MSEEKVGAQAQSAQVSETLKNRAKERAEGAAKELGAGYSAMEVPASQKEVTLYNESSQRGHTMGDRYNQPLRFKGKPLYYVVDENGMPVRMFYKRSDSSDVEIATAENGKWCRHDD